MGRESQADLFQQYAQSDQTGEDTPTSEYRADPDSVRAELYKILAEARAAQKLPWAAQNGFVIPDHLSANDELAPRRRRRNCALSSRRK